MEQLNRPERTLCTLNPESDDLLNPESDDLSGLLGFFGDVVKMVDDSEDLYFGEVKATTSLEQLCDDGDE